MSGAVSGPTHPADLALSELLPKLREDRLTPEEYYQDVLERIGKREGVLQALLPEEGRADRLFATADELRRRFPPGERPPLYGALFGVKDIFKVDGFPMQAGSRLPKEAFEGPQATIVSRLLELGAVPLGRTVTTEFAYFAPGPTTNPLNPGHTPGGSSSGSAAAVGAGYCRFALGTQTIGSIIRPAAFCGIAGFKPSHETFSRSGVFPFSESADHVGFLLGSVGDGLLLLDAVNARAGALQASTGPGNALESTRLTVPDDAYISQVEPQTLKQFNETLLALQEAGATIVRSAALREIEEIAVAHRRMIAREFFQNHQALFRQYEELYSEASVELYREGEAVAEVELSEAREGRLALRRSLDQELAGQGCVAWLSPAGFTTAPKGLSSTGSPAMNLPWTYAGVPTVNVPSGSDLQGLPYGLQVAGRFGGDRAVLELGIRLERVLGA